MQAPAPATAAWTCDRSPLLVANARIWQSGGASAAAQDLLVDGGRVAAIGERGALPRPAWARQFDVGGALVLPGLIDAHAHLDALPGAPGGPAIPREDVVAAAGRQTLASGVTTVRVHLSGLADGPALAARSIDACAPLPRVVLGGPGLTGGAPDLNARLMRGVRSPDDGVAKVAEVAASGAVWIALHRLDAMTADERRAVTAEARRLGLRVMGAGDEFDEARAALAAGVDSLEYLNRTEAPAYPADLLDGLRAAADRLTVVAPIGYHTRYVGVRQRPADVRRPELVRFYPPAAIAPAIDALERHLREAPAESIDRASATLAAKFRQIRATGVPMALGSDSGSTAQFHIDAIWQELRAWHALGVPPDDILRAGTSVAGRLLGDSAAGRLQVGDPADFLIYRGTPARGEFDRRHLDTVVKGGAIFVRGGRWVGP